jgi:hypothetical protein
MKNKSFFVFVFLICIIGTANALPEVKIANPDPGPVAGDYFGRTVCIDGDYAIIGSNQDDHDELTDAGSAYIYHRSGSDWTLQAVIAASDAEAVDWFGTSVSISGDYAIVGARYEDPGDVSVAGSAYIFLRDGENWTQQAKLVASDPEADDWFGCSVSISGDYAIVGAVYEDPTSTNAGSAYIFHRVGENWTQQAKKSCNSPLNNDAHFGNSVSICGDYAIVGEPMGIYDFQRTGAVYIFHRVDESWSQTKLYAADGIANDYFGNSVSIDGNYAIVGAHGEDPGEVNGAGSAYIFCYDGDSWDEQAKIAASDTGETDQFGYTVSISGDYAIVGANYEDPGGLGNAGSAYVFHRDGTSWTQHTKLVASDGEANDQFGWAININGGWAMVGAPYENPGGVSSSGSAYIYMFRNHTYIATDTYTLMGIPVMVTDGDAAALFQDDFGGNPPGDNIWRVSRWRIYDQQYIRYGEPEASGFDEGDPPDFAPGYSFWCITATENCMLEIDDGQIEDLVPENQRFALWLEPRVNDSHRGCNQLANPFYYDYDWRTTRFFRKNAC